MRAATHLRLSTVLLLAATSLALPRPAAAQKHYEITGYDVTLAVDSAGDYTVTERIAYDFEGGTFTFATREIPLRYIDRVDVLGVDGGDVATSDLSAHRSEGEERIRWRFPATKGPATFTLRYRVHGALFEADGRNVVDWDAIGRGWTVPITGVRVAVLLPPSLGVAPDSIRFQPPAGRLAPVPGGARVDFSYPRLEPGTAYRVVVSFPHRVAGRDDWPGVEGGAGLVDHRRPPLPAAYVWETPLAFLLGLLPGLLLFARLGGPRREVSAEFEPPTDLATAAALLYPVSAQGERVFSATLFDLASRGVVELRRVRVGHGPFSSKEVEVVVQPQAAPLPDFEASFVAELEKHRTLTRFARKGAGFRRRALAALRRETTARGLMVDHHTRGTTLIIAGVLLAFTFVLPMALPAIPLVPVAALLVGAGLGLGVAGFRMATPTDVGALLIARVKAYLRHLREEIERREATSPTEAARLYIASLPWLSLDAKVTRGWVRKLAKSLEDTDEPLEVPGWAMDATGETVSSHSAAYVAFMPYYHVTAAASAGVAPSGGGAGGGGGGAG